MTDPEAARSVRGLIRASWQLVPRTLADLVNPDAPAEERHPVANALGRDVSPEVAAKYIEFLTTSEITSFLPRVQAPTLVVVTTVSGGGVVAGVVAAAAAGALVLGSAAWYARRRAG